MPTKHRMDKPEKAMTVPRRARRISCRDTGRIVWELLERRRQKSTTAVQKMNPYMVVKCV